MKNKMKKLRGLRMFGLLIVLASCLSLPLFTTGCHTPPERKAFSAAVGTRVGVEVAVEEFKALAKSGKVHPDQIALARKALASYKAADDAYLAALEVAITTKDQSTADRAQLVWKATYGDLWKILVVYVPRLDPIPPQAITR